MDSPDNFGTVLFLYFFLLFKIFSRILILYLDNTM